MLFEYLRIAYTNLHNRQLRTWLTVLGIIISVASILALITISNGLEEGIRSEFESIGTKKIYISGGGGAQDLDADLTRDDVETLEKFSEFDFVTPYLMKGAGITYRNEEQFATVMGIPAEDMEDLYVFYDFPYMEGRSLADGDRFSAVLGSAVAEDLFDRELRNRNSIDIDGYKFRVVGVLEETGDPGQDQGIVIPMDTARDIFDEPDKVNFIDATVKDGVDIQRLAERIERALERKRGDENFTVLTPEQILKQFETILGIVQGILVSIAAISLVVGAIGIMNSMYTSVMERTKEIGVMKSVGARNLDIVMLFLIESGIIGFMGGVVGIILGIAMSFGVGAAAAGAGFALLQITIDPYVVLGSMIFAIGIGMLSGLLPSRQAASLHPVDALRHGK